MFRWLLALLLLAAAAAAAAYFVAGHAAPPQIAIAKPDRVVGQAGSLDVTAAAPNGRFTALTIALEQNGKSIPLFALDSPQAGDMMTRVDRDHVRVSRPIGRRAIPELRSGAARIVVTATRPSFLNLRQVTATASKDVQVRLEAPKIAILSTKHYVNHGGSEFVVYRISPPDVASGVRVGDVEYPGYPIGEDPAVRGAFFALLWDQPLNTRIQAFARDEADNEAKASFVDNVFEKPFKKSRIELDDAFIDRVVPEILEHSPELNMSAPSGDQLPAFLKINGELRRLNNAKIESFAKQTSPRRLWEGAFVQLGNSKVEAAFADQRTYFYKGQEVDHQVHLGFDLAVTSRTPVVASNNGKVLNASWLGIYGNCIILDHGMGVQSLYGHLSSFDVNVGDTVTRGQTIGRSGMTGLAGGDHLHFTMLVGGRMVNPVEWWDPHWIADRVDRKLGEGRVQ